MSGRMFLTLGKGCRWQSKVGEKSVLSVLSLSSVRRFGDSRGKLIIEPGSNVPGELYESLDAGEWKRRKVAELGADYAYPGWRPMEFKRKPEGLVRDALIEMSYRTFFVCVLFTAATSYAFYIREKQKLWMRTDHPEYYTNYKKRWGIVDKRFVDDNQDDSTNDNGNTNETVADAA